MTLVIERLLHPWRSGRLWRSLANAALDLPVGTVVFFPTIGLSILTLAIAITLLFALLSFTGLFVWTHLMGMVERSRTAALLGTRLENPHAPLPKGSPWTKAKAAVRDRARWREFGYCLLRLPASVAIAAIVLGSWSASLALAALPAYVSSLPQGTAQFGLFGASQGVAAAVLAIVGITGLVIIAPWLTLAAAHVDRGLSTWLLGPPKESELLARASRAESGRAAAVDAAESERRRIERDLHDGAQQRLVALAVDLGAARERFDTDPEGARALVAEAHDEAKATLREIRDLVRGIHPVILGDRGLDAALSAVVARSPVPVELTVELRERPPDAVESAAYFVVSEALANVAHHARATRAYVGIVTSGDRLVVEIRDDGVGGVDLDRGTGLKGLRDRVVSLGGTMDILSPDGGPTTILVELPCES